MSKWDIFMLVMQCTTLIATAINFWCFYKVPILKRAIRTLSESNANWQAMYDGLTKRHRLIIEKAITLQQLLNGRP